MHVVYTVVHHGAPLNFANITVQAVIVLFLPLLILAPTFTNAHAAASETAGLISASLLFLGVPMLGSAIFFHLLSRPIAPARL